MTEYNPSAGMTGFDNQETMLATYWNTSFSKICLGMKIDQQINFILLDKVAESLYSLIADGQYRNTSLGRNTWKTLVGSDASLQLNCNKEGFNAHKNSRGAKARIGIIGNDHDNCSTVIPESVLVRVVYMMTLTRVETWQKRAQIMGTNSSKPWDTFLFSNKTFPLVTTVHVNISSITSNDINRLLNFTRGLRDLGI